MLIEGAALQSGARGVLSHGERLVQPLGARLRSPILFHRIMGHQRGKHRATEGRTGVTQWPGEMLPLLRMVMQGWWDIQADCSLQAIAT